MTRIALVSSCITLLVLLGFGLNRIAARSVDEKDVFAFKLDSLLASKGEVERGIIGVDDTVDELLFADNGYQVWMRRPRSALNAVKVRGSGFGRIYVFYENKLADWTDVDIFSPLFYPSVWLGDKEIYTVSNAFSRRPSAEQEYRCTVKCIRDGLPRIVVEENFIPVEVVNEMNVVRIIAIQPRLAGYADVIWKKLTFGQEHRVASVDFELIRPLIKN